MNFTKPKSSLCPTNGPMAVGDGAAYSFDSDPRVLAVCQLEGSDNMYYYSTTFSGGPEAKCPPDRGSSHCVRDSAAPVFPSYPFPPSPSNTFQQTTYESKFPIGTAQSPSPYHKAFAAAPRAIPKRAGSDLATPPLTPDEGSDSGSEFGGDEKDALDFLMTVFPDDGLSALPYAKRVNISGPQLAADFHGMVLALPGQPKTLYVDGKSAQMVSLRDSIVALLDLADEQLECTALVIVLERSSSHLSELLHALMYVGGSVVTKPAFKVDPAFVMVGLEI
ncbi:hypothetical protein CYLTODRAFT_448076 [Cylindrobasidium torrendii FP15055 ss-10]|uniref:Ornithine decarboxylase antizyme n=1 Tax=Cylindrobasidium torrendii FP15055 ss-10 TaxID=1314674 RepID=A0A0D7BVW1_9AGAR|nr:hypothetical protein CYLTODRAFT_448076 [Cylindrobasidium torrendii FP15055 ss-10]